MKRYILLLSFLVSGLSIFAQSGNLVFFSDEGTKFYVVVNGLRINDEPLSNVRLTDLNADYVHAKIVFADETIADIDKKTLMLQRGYETTYTIKKNKKGETVCNWYSSVELAQVPPPASNQRVIVYSQVPPNDGIVIRGGTTTTTTTTTSTTGNANVVGASVNVGGVGMNVTINDGTGYTGTTTTSYTTTTTTTSSNTGSGTVVTNDCIYGMSDTDFRNAKNSISSATFDDTKKSTFKQVVSSKCVTTKQVKEMLGLFTFEDTQLELAKYAYQYVSDPSNYYTVNDIFTFDSNKDELSNYVMSNQR